MWADLSTFDVAVAKAFYQKCFDWDYQSLEDGYELCNAQHSVAGLYAMPDKFKAMNMPSFWMSYIHVEDINKVVAAAQRNGGKVELPPQPGPGGGTIALIRDPAGAGFTCFEGEATETNRHVIGSVVWNELHVSNLQLVKSFYENVFHWSIKPTPVANRFEIFEQSETPSTEQHLVAGIQVTSNEIKGDKEYWGVYFLVNDLQKSAITIEKAGGNIVAEQPLGERQSILAYDSQGAAFYIVESVNSDSQKVNSSNTSFQTTLKWVLLGSYGLIMLVVLIWLLLVI